MTLQHGNRIRRTDRQAVRELQAAETGDGFIGGPTQDEIQERAHEIYLSRSGAPGNAVLDWLQAEIELRSNQSDEAQSR